MKAAVLHQVKAPLAIEDVPEPSPRPGEVLIELRAAALNRRDYWITQGLYPGIKVPCILGSDGAGTVVEVGSDISTRLIGQEVVINPGLEWGPSEGAQSTRFRILGMPDDGTFAEYVVVPLSNVYPKPPHLSWHEAAALPLAALTAYRAAFTQGELTAADRVLVTGIGGGVATFVLQYSVAVRAEVLVTSSAQEKIEKAIELGARSGYNYTDPQWDEAVLEASGEVNLAVDGAGGKGFEKILKLLAPGGRVVTYGVTAGAKVEIPLNRLFWRQLRIIGSTMGSPRDFERMLDFVTRHLIRPAIDSVFPLDRINDGLERMRRGEHFGKIVIEIPH